MGFEPALTAIDEDLAELAAMGAALSLHSPRLGAIIAAKEIDLRAAIKAATHPLAAERALSSHASALRALWLRNAAAIAAETWRSPTAAETARLERGPHDAFGYERDLQPKALETRAAAFLPAPPGRRAEHVLAHSGQAAMTLVLLALAETGATTLAHAGAYFETRDLLAALPLRPAPPETSDVLLVEPIACNGAFARNDAAGLLARRTAAALRALILDATLMGRAEHLLAPILPHDPALIIRISSTLKLMQGGLELANAGLISLYARDPGPMARRLRRLRTLIGAGLSEADAIALEAPWFLDPAATDAYVGAVFANNARLAHALAAANTRFAPVRHPGLDGGDAPFCALGLTDPSEPACAALEREIAEAAQVRRLKFDRGGSFGFRDHRYEIVRPETGEPSFLRIAMGRRGGWSCDGIISMLAALCGRRS